MNCLWCDKEIIIEISWNNLISLSKPKKLCKFCEAEFAVVDGPRCEKCSCASVESICSDCSSWTKYEGMEDVIAFNHSIYIYNEQMKEVISKWKYRGDYVLAEIFQDAFIDTFKTEFSFLREAILVPIPLSDTRLSERGFNQAKVLADMLPLETVESLERIHGEKQSKKTRKERMTTRNPFVINKRVNKPVILVDDIYTTGTTLRHAAKTLKDNGYTDIYAYTLIRG